MSAHWGDAIAGALVAAPGVLNFWRLKYLLDHVKRITVEVHTVQDAITEEIRTVVPEVIAETIIETLGEGEGHAGSS